MRTLFYNTQSNAGATATFLEFYCIYKLLPAYSQNVNTTICLSGL